MTNRRTSAIISIVVKRYCVMVARQILILFVGVRVPIPLRKSIDFVGAFLFPSIPTPQQKTLSFPYPGTHSVLFYFIDSVISAVPFTVTVQYSDVTSLLTA